MRRIALFVCLLWGCVKVHEGDKTTLPRNPIAPASQAVQAKVTAEWIEYFHGKHLARISYNGGHGIWELTTSSILVTREENGVKSYVLIDTGVSPDAKKDRKEIKYGKGRIFSIFGVKGKDQVATTEALKPYLSSIKYVIPSHIHGDHTGGLVALAPMLSKDAKIILTEEEAKFGEDKQVAGTFHVSWSYLDAMKSNIVVADKKSFSSGLYRGFQSSLDLFGDQSVVIVPMPGHTPGSVGVFINTTDGKSILYVGDTLNNADALETNASKSWPMSRTDCQKFYSELEGCDVQSMVENLGAKNKIFKTQTPSTKIIPAHDRKSWVAVFQKPSNR